MPMYLSPVPVPICVEAGKLTSPLLPHPNLRRHQLVHIRPLDAAIVIALLFLPQQYSQDLDRRRETEFMGADPALRAGYADCWL